MLSLNRVPVQRAYAIRCFLGEMKSSIAIATSEAHFVGLSYCAAAIERIAALFS